MKKLSLIATLTSVLLGLTSTEVQAANTNFLLLQFTATAVSTTTNSPVVTTNAAGTVTQTYRTITNIITTADILRMLATEYGTNFPTGAKIAVQISGGSGGVKVLNANYEVLLDVSQNLSVSNNVVSGASPVSAVFGKITSNNTTTNYTQSYTELDADSAFYYQDTHGNNFHVVGVETSKHNDIYTATTARSVSQSKMITGSGGGTFVVRGQQLTGVFTRATVTAAGANLVLDNF